MSMLDAYLISYGRRRRAVAVLRAIFLAIAVGMVVRWLAPGNLGLILCGLIGFAIVARPVWFLFRRYDAVGIAMEIESVQPAFDQKLITIVSQQTSSPLLDHLLADIKPLMDQSKGRSLVSLRPLVWSGATLVGISLVLVIAHHR